MSMTEWGSLIIPVLAVLYIIFFIDRPRRKRDGEQAKHP